ncbi:unnamed protein product [Camellia sinensis]
MEENMVGIIIALARDDIKIIFYLLFNSALAYCVNLTNFLVTKHTNALTLQEVSKPLTAFKSFDNPNRLQIIRVPVRSKSLLSSFFVKQKKTKLKTIS